MRSAEAVLLFPHVNVGHRQAMVVVAGVFVDICGVLRRTTLVVDGFLLGLEIVLWMDVMVVDGIEVAVVSVVSVVVVVVRVLYV